MFRNVVWSETAESCLNKTTNNDAYGADTLYQSLYQFVFKKEVKHRFSRKQLGSVAGPVIQANGLLKFEDDVRSGGLLHMLYYTVNQCLH